jgi:hypothetical protein
VKEKQRERCNYVKSSHSKVPLFVICNLTLFQLKHLATFKIQFDRNIKKVGGENSIKGNGKSQS